MCDGGPCDGNTLERFLFDKQIMVPICDKHYKIHGLIFDLCNNGHDIEVLARKSLSELVELKNNDDNKVGDDKDVK